MESFSNLRRLMIMMEQVFDDHVDDFDNGDDGDDVN